MTPRMLIASRVFSATSRLISIFPIFIMHRQSMVNQLKAAALVLLVSACESKADSKPAPDSSNASKTTAVSSSDTPADSTDANSAQTASSGGFQVTLFYSDPAPTE